MVKRVQRVRHDPATAALFVGLEGEITGETTNNRIHYHDGVTAGGHIIPNQVAVVAFDNIITNAFIAADAVVAGAAVQKSVMTNSNDVIVSSAATTEGVVNLVASTMLARLAAGNVVAATPAEIRTLLNVEDGSTADQSDAEIKTAYEANADTNVFTDAEQTKLASITVANDIFAAGTKMVFFQATAPTGWTQDVTHNDKVFRVVSGAGGGSGTGQALNTFGLAGVSVDGHALTITEMPSHSHGIGPGSQATAGTGPNRDTPSASESLQSTSKGGGTTHLHGLTVATTTFRPAYIDVIVCIKI